jgi:hypothetical protein
MEGIMSQDGKTDHSSSQLPTEEAAGLSRRDLLHWSGVTGLSAMAAAVLPNTAAAAMLPAGNATGATTEKSAGVEVNEPAPLHVQATPIRPPAVPLAVRQPYLSSWLPGTLLPGTWPQFWEGSTTEMAGIVRIDGVAYLFMGDPQLVLDVPDGNHGTPHTIQDFPRALDQTALRMTPTRSRFELQGGGVGLVVEFLSPVEPDDLKRQSIPLSYVTVTANSIDGQTHQVQIYLDISGGWASGDRKQKITWAPLDSKDMQAWTVELTVPQPLTEQKEFAAWGTIVWATGKSTGLTFESGEDIHIRGQFVKEGKLNNSSDKNYRAIDDRSPVFGLSVDLGHLGDSGVTTEFIIGHVRTPALSYLGKPVQPLWTKYFNQWQDMLAIFYTDAAGAAQRADSLDARITKDAQAAGGTSYVGLCTLALRQAYGGTELVEGPDGEPWAFLKEISSDGNVSTIDVLYPASPVWIYLDPAYMRLLLTPLLVYAEAHISPKKFAEHDLGASYPNAAGHADGKEEDMPVEETGNILIMVAAYLRRASKSDAMSFATTHYRILKQWTDYLTTVLPDPGFQNQTDDFAGSIAHSVNLALKGIIAVAAMGQIATIAGHSEDTSHYQELAVQYMKYWTKHSQDPSGLHLDLTYSGAGGGDGTWGTLYNAFADTMLGTGLIPESIRKEQAAWYAQASNVFGLPLQVPHSYAKSDWELFTAAWLSDYPVKQQLIDHVFAYANATPDRVPFSDLYSTITGHYRGFRARPVQGGLFAPLAALAAKTSS